MRRHVVAIGILLALSAIVQVWSIRQAVTPALDAVRYAAFAERIERDSWLAAVRGESEHPLFPTWVAATHQVIESVTPSSPTAWATCVQATAAVPLVLAIVPLYLLLLRAFGARTALAGGLMFCLLPRVARLGADGTSDSVALLLCLIAAWCVVEHFVRSDALRGLPGRSNRWVDAAWLFAAGLAAGMSLLARAEGLLLLGAIGAAGIVDQGRRSTRQAWPRWLAACGGLALGLMLIWGPFIAVVGANTPGRVVARVLGRGDGPATAKPPTSVARKLPPTWTLPDGAAMKFPVKESGASSRFRGLPAAIARYGREASGTLHYWIAGLAAYGVWIGRRRPWSGGQRFLVMLFIVVSLGTIAMASRAGYLTTRHLLLLVPAALGPSANGADDLGRRLNAAIAGMRTRWAKMPRWTSALRWERVLTPLFAIALLPATLTAVHPSRISHRQAAHWLTMPGRTPGAVLDTRGLTGLYSGRPTRRYDSARQAFADPGLAYIVIEAGELQADSDRARTLRGLLSAAGALVAEFPSPKDVERENVLIYHWRPEDFASWVQAGRGVPPRHVADGGRSHE